jgi:hypothetical protein
VGTSDALTRLGLALALLAGVPGCLVDDPSKEEREEQERQDAKRLDAFYEMEWIKCVNDLGIDRCRIIQETGFQQCRGHRSVDPHRTGNNCVDDRLSDRRKSLAPKKGKNARSAPAFTEAPLPAEAPDASEKENF